MFPSKRRYNWVVYFLHQWELTHVNVEERRHLDRKYNKEWWYAFEKDFLIKIFLEKDKSDKMKYLFKWR